MRHQSHISLAIILLLPVLVISQSWDISSIDVGIKPVIALDTNQNVHIAYMHEARPGWVRHAQIQDSTIEITTLTEGYFYGPLDIAINPLNNYPGVVYHDHDEAGGDEAYVAYNGVDWELSFVNSAGHDGWDNSIVYDKTGTPHTASVDPAGGGVEYATFVNGDWVKESIGSLNTNYKYATSIVVDENNEPHIAFYVDGDNSLYYVTKSNGQWLSGVVDDTGGRYPSMILGQDGNIHIAYIQSLDNNEVNVKYAVQINGNWNITQVDVLNNAPQSIARRITSLKQDIFGNIYLAYCDEDFLVLSTLDNNEWIKDTVVNGPNLGIELGVMSSLAIDNQGFPHITYAQKGQGPLDTIKYAVRTNLKDQDNDGYNEDIDCNDLNANINPGATEIPNNAVDENCDGEILFIDEDMDGFHSGIDCDDSDPDINPNAIEIINNDVDEDCDGIAQMIDEDMDGFNSIVDCDDMNADINPAATEIPNNDVDENCDGEIGVDNRYSIAGIITTSNGKPIPNVTVDITQASSLRAISDASGRFTFNDAKIDADAIITFKKDGNDANGLSSIDIIQMTNHILGRAVIEDNLTLQAADVNGDDRVSSLDIIELLNVILGKWDTFNTKDSWEFSPSLINIPDPQDLDLDIKGIKIGDLNESADPNN